MLEDPAAWLIGAAVFGAALLYSAIGHGGGSGYLAVFALAGLAPAEMKPAALALNVLVAGIGTVRFLRAGAFRWRLFWPFALASVPCAALGGALQLPAEGYRPLVALALALAAARMLLLREDDGDGKMRAPPLPLALGSGAGIGLLSGLTGVGGGIFLSPLLALARWGGMRTIAAVSAPFVLVNSAAGLAGLAIDGLRLPSAAPAWALAAGLGGLIGSGWGARRLRARSLRAVLALVLLSAAAKTAFL